MSDLEWDTVIRPNGLWLDLKLSELWRYRDLIALFVRRDFVAHYKQTILGPLWHLIQPLLTAFTFTIVFGSIAKIPTDGVPPFLFYLGGNVMWNYFTNCLNRTSNTFVVNAGIFGKVYFPRLAVPVSSVISSLISFGIQFAIFLAAILFYRLQGNVVEMSAAALLMPVLLLLMGGMGLGFGIIISSLTTRYRDLANLVGFGVALWMYLTPVIYPLSVIPEKYRMLVLLNPLTPFMETFRFAFLGAGTVHLPQLAYGVGCTAVVLTAGVLLFNRVERTFMDTV